MPRDDAGTASSSIHDSTVMDMDAADGSDGKGAVGTETNTIPIQKLACDRCRARKIRCNRGEPCAPCIRKQTRCTYPAGYKPREKRQKTYLSNSYEEKIEDISRKLDSICSLVNTMSAGSAQPQQPRLLTQVVSIPSPCGPSPSSQGNAAADTSDTELEGELSLTAHAAFAAEFVEQAVTKNHAMRVSPEMTSSLNALRNIVDTHSPGGRHGGERAHSVLNANPSDSIGDIQMPPLDLAFRCLGMIKERPEVRMMWCYEIDSISQFMDYFLTVYSGKPSTAQLIIVNAGLDRLFAECSVVESDPALKADYKAQASACRQNMESVLTRLPFILPFTIDYALALSLASTHYMDRGKPSLAWNFSVTAAHMCQSLGFHRDAPMDPESLETRKRRTRLFWSVCLTEKSLALRLGRPSTIRNSEITIPRSVEDDIAPDGGVSPILTRWIDLTLLQDRVYDDIYSPSALSQPEEVRIGRARSLAAELQHVFEFVSPLEERYQVLFKDVLGEKSDIYYQAEKVSYLAVLTLIYRSIPPSPYSGSAFGEECIATAMQALDEHEKCISRLHNQCNESVLNTYIEWALLSAPFVPFIIIFCHVIETSSPLYLSKLASLTGTLKVATPDFPGAYGKQCAIFTLMYEVACKYVEARAAAGGDSGTAGPGGAGQVSAEAFDDLFGDAGISAQLRSPILRFSETGGRQAFGGLDHPGADATEDGAVGGRVTENGADLGNWFDQNHQIFRMMDDADS